VEFRNLKVSEADGIGWLRFGRPPVNALNTETLFEVERAFDWFEKQDDVLVVVLTGEGKAFVAGADIAEMKDFSPMQAREFSRHGHQAMGKVASIGKPVIAAINGFALGGGCEIALACDIRVIADSARIGQPEAKLGLVPGFGGTQRLPRLVGPGIAKELIYTGEAIDASLALRIGLVNRVVPKEKLLDYVTELAKKIARNGPNALRLAKATIDKGLDADLTTGNSYEAAAFGKCFSSGESAEGIAAFLEKRKPEWRVTNS